MSYLKKTWDFGLQALNDRISRVTKLLEARPSPWSLSFLQISIAFLEASAKMSGQDQINWSIGKINQDGGDLRPKHVPQLRVTEGIGSTIWFKGYERNPVNHQVWTAVGYINHTHALRPTSDCTKARGTTHKNSSRETSKKLTDPLQGISREKLNRKHKQRALHDYMKLTAVSSPFSSSCSLCVSLI